MLIPPLLHVATDVATCNRGPILCKLDFGSVYTNKSTQLPQPSCAPAARSAAAVRAPATQQTQYLGESAETPETAATGLELPFPATTFRAATPPASSIGGCNLRPERCPASPTQRPAYPRAQPARTGVRSEPPHPAERTNKKTACSHGSGGLDDRPHRLQQQVNPSPRPHHPALRRTSAHARTRARSTPTRTSIPNPATSLTSHEDCQRRALLALPPCRSSMIQAFSPPLTLAPKHLPRSQRSGRLHASLLAPCPCRCLHLLASTLDRALSSPHRRRCPAA